MDKINILKQMIDNSNRIVVFTGAGASTESGIPDFRSKDGLYNMKYEYPPEQILSHNFFKLKPEIFYKFYKDKMNCIGSRPNDFHLYLKELENSGKNITIITQNIDGLHSKANSNKVIELHGTIYKNKCTICNKVYDEKIVFNNEDVIPKCSCGGIIKPDVVLYGEPLDERFINEAIYYIKNADLILIAGTSLNVYPASGFINYFRGKYMVIINRDKTIQDKNADLVINDSLCEVVKMLNNK